MTTNGVTVARILATACDVRAVLLLDDAMAAATGVKATDDESWLSCADALPHVDVLLDGYLRRPSLTCCSFIGGFRIDVDGSWWNDGGIDEFWMSATWPTALADVLEQGEGGAAGGPAWEESTLMLTHRGVRLWLDDAAARTWPPVDVALRPFAESVLREAKLFQRLMRAFDAAVIAREAQLPGADDAGKLAVVRENLVLLEQDGGAVARLERALRAS